MNKNCYVGSMANSSPVFFLWTSQIFIEYIHFIALLVCSKGCPFWSFGLSCVWDRFQPFVIRVYNWFRFASPSKINGETLKRPNVWWQNAEIFSERCLVPLLFRLVYKLKGAIIGFLWVWMNPFEVFTAFSAQCLTYYCYSKRNNGLNFNCSWIRGLLFIIFTFRLYKVKYRVKI